MWQKQTHESSFRESVKALEADLQYANNLAAAFPRNMVEERIQMRLSYSPLAPFFLFIMEWMDYTCLDTIPNCLGLLHIVVYKAYVDGMPMMSSEERKATLREFYAVIFPSLKQLEGNLMELVENGNGNNRRSEILERNAALEQRRHLDQESDSDREDECGICMESCTNMVLPNCGHSMCINCFYEWNIRSESCPFCRGSLKRVSESDLWVLIGGNDVVDMITVVCDNLRRFYLYIQGLPLLASDTPPLLLFDYMF